MRTGNPSSAAASLLAALAIGLLAMTGSARAVAGDSAVRTADYLTDDAADDAFVTPVSYSTGTAGHKLKWLPYRPSKATLAAGSATMERTAQYTSEAPARPNEADPFNDPFGDKTRVSQVAPPTRIPDLEPPKKADLEPSPSDVLPRLLAEEPTLEGESFEESEVIGEEELERALVAGPGAGLEPCPVAADLKRIREITHDISAKGDKFPQECTLGEEPFQPRSWAPTTFTWKASGLCHKPAYFEDVQLERYGHSWGPYLQPVFSGAHFFLTVPVLPYKMGLYPPQECIYTLGYYRPGSCAPYMLDPLPLSIRAGLAEAGVWTGLIYAIP